MANFRTTELKKKLLKRYCDRLQLLVLKRRQIVATCVACGQLLKKANFRTFVRRAAGAAPKGFGRKKKKRLAINFKKISQTTVAAALSIR